MQKLLTIGMSTYDDFHGVYFSIQSLKMYHELHDVEIIVIDNNPNSEHGKATKNMAECVGRYIPYEERKGTSVRNEVFNNALGKYTLCIDCHVLLCKNFINNLLKYYASVGSDCKNIVSGPMYDDRLNVHATQFDPVWRSHMYGIWGFNKEAYESGQPFEIPMMGLGVFSCETKNWLGFNKDFRGFGGEEGYIHEKFRKAGGKAVCVPQLKWLHRFSRPDGVKYPLAVEDRIWNYFIGWLELTNDENHQMISDIRTHFHDNLQDPRIVDKVLEEAKIYHRNKYK